MNVQKIISQLCSPCLGSVHSARVSAVETCAAAVAYAGSVCPSRMGRMLRSRAKPKHSIKRVDRLLGNSHLHTEWHKFYAAVADRVLRGSRRPIVIVDWSGATAKKHTLTAATPVGGRAVPLYAEVHPQSKYANRAVQEQFLQTLRKVLGSKRTPIVVADAGFGAPFMNAVKALGWDFVIRVRGGVCMRQGLAGPWLKSHILYRQATRKPRCLGVRRFSRERSTHVTDPLEVRLILSKKPPRKGPKRPMRSPVSGANSGGASILAAAREPWLLATTLDCEPSEVVALYALRMQIEETFRDFKNHRFGWSLRHVGSRCHKRVTTLLLLATIAMVAVMMIGIAVEARNLHRQFQANTLTRRVLSHFFLGATILQRQLLPVTVSEASRLSQRHFRKFARQRA